LLETDCSSPLASVAIGEPGIDNNGQRYQRVRVRVAAVPPGRHDALIKILTSHGTFSEITVPIRMEAPQ
jgi:hypothetical protein